MVLKAEGRGHAPAFLSGPRALRDRTCPSSPFVLLSFPASLIGVEGGNATRIGRFANYLRNLLPSNDPVVMEMASKAIGRLAMAGDTFTAEYVEFEVKRALEWLGADRNEGRRHAAVSARGEGCSWPGSKGALSGSSAPRVRVPERQAVRGRSRQRRCAS